MRWTIRVKVVAMAVVLVGAIGSVAAVGLYAIARSTDFVVEDLPLAVGAADGAMESRIAMLQGLWGAIQVTEQASEASVRGGLARIDTAMADFGTSFAELEATRAVAAAVTSEAKALHGEFRNAVAASIEARKRIDETMEQVDAQTEAIVESAIAAGASPGLVHAMWKLTMAANDYAFTGLADARETYDSLRPVVSAALEENPTIADDGRAYLAATDGLMTERGNWAAAAAAVETTAVALDTTLAVAEAGDTARGVVGADGFLLGHIADFEGEVSLSRTVQIALAAAAAVVGVFFALLIGGSIARRVNVLRARVDDIAQGDGDLTRRLAADSNDELGELANSFNTFIEKIHDMVSHITETATALTGSAESLSSTSTQLSSGARSVDALTTEADEAVRSVLERISMVASAIEQTSATVTQTAAASEQIATGVTSVAAGAEEMSGNITTVAAAVEQLSASLAEVAGNSAESASAGRQSAEKSRDAAERISVLAEAAARIGKVIQLIEDIADQTNLLALNATIEAASAGEAGRGFTVVANEIKELAKQTTRATDEIVQEVDAIQQATQGAVDRIREVTADAERVDHLAAVIAAAVEEQSATTGEVSMNVAGGARAAGDVSQSVTQIAQGVDEIARQTSEVAAGAGEIAASSSDAVIAANSVATSIGQVRFAASETASAAEEVARAASEGMQLASALQQLVGQFRI